MLVVQVKLFADGKYIFDIGLPLPSVHFCLTGLKCFSYYGIAYDFDFCYLIYATCYFHTLIVSAFPLPFSC